MMKPPVTIRQVKLLASMAACFARTLRDGIIPGLLKRGNTADSPQWNGSNSLIDFYNNQQGRGKGTLNDGEWADVFAQTAVGGIISGIFLHGETFTRNLLTLYMGNFMEPVAGVFAYLASGDIPEPLETCINEFIEGVNRLMD